MKNKNAVTLEELDKNKVKKDKNDNNFGKFIKEKILPLVIVSAVICLLFTIAFIIPEVNNVKKLNCTTLYCSDEVLTISENFFSRFQVILLTAFAAIVPYFYLPFLGLISYMYNEVITIAHIISLNGYFLGIIKYLIPFITNIIVISLVTATGIYIAKIFTAKFALDRSKNMNFINFRIKLYEMLKNEKKIKELNSKKEEKQKKWKNRVEKIAWKNVIMILGLACGLQLISVILQNILI